VAHQDKEEEAVWASSSFFYKKGEEKL